MLGREVRCPLDLILGTRGELVEGGTAFGTDLRNSWEDAFKLAREELGMAQRRQKRYITWRKG